MGTKTPFSRKIVSTTLKGLPIQKPRCGDGSVGEAPLRAPFKLEPQGSLLSRSNSPAYHVALAFETTVLVRAFHSPTPLVQEEQQRCTRKQGIPLRKLLTGDFTGRPAMIKFFNSENNFLCNGNVIYRKFNSLPYFKI